MRSICGTYLVFRVSTVDDDISGVKERNKLINKRVNGSSGLHKQHYTARLLQLVNHILKKLASFNIKL
jgi:hypothetical protein